MSLIDSPVRYAMTKDVKTIEESKLVLDCVKAMSDSNIGCLVAVRKDQTPVGIFTERDLVKSIASKGRNVLAEPVSAAMSRPLTIISPGATVWDAMTLMGRAKIRRLPVVDGGRLIGILTERDVFRFILSQQNLLLETVSERFPSATREQLRGIAASYGSASPPGRAGSRAS